MKKHGKILIVDDSEINRSLLADMLEDEYDIMEASNGLEAISVIGRCHSELSLVLLDIVMPMMDGFQLLTLMNQNGWIDTLPVIIISSETASAYIDHSFDLGAAEYISRPFDEKAVKRRIKNMVLLFSKQKKLEDLLVNQMLEKERSTLLMVEVLSHLVEFRNGESGLHVLNIRVITDTLLKHLAKRTDQYALTPERISLIATASAMHDIGKISIDEAILNKPGKLTPGEYDVVKTHCAIGAQMLESSVHYKTEPLIQIARDICRWHHERYDGQGYPDGLKRDEIPISAQVVAIADVYDALISPRVYKPAYSHEQAVRMILNGECGCFNPLLLECLSEAAPFLESELHVHSPGSVSRSEIQNASHSLMRIGHASNRTLSLLEQERTKYQFFVSMYHEIQFEYDNRTDIVTLSDWGAEQLGLSTSILHPMQDPAVLATFPEENIRDMRRRLIDATPESPLVASTYRVCIRGQKRWFKAVMRPLWLDEEEDERTGVIGKLMDVHKEQEELTRLKQLAQRDPLTGLYNRTCAQEMIESALKLNGRYYAMLLLDMDCFKSANDSYGHMFGDDVLKEVATRLRSTTRSSDIVSRIGGDEFMVFMLYHGDMQPLVERISRAFSEQYQGFSIDVSIGVALSPRDGTDFETLFLRADQALYDAKHAGKGCWRCYDPSMKNVLLSPSQNKPGASV